MKKTLEQMQLDIITKYGHEDPRVVEFCRKCDVAKRNKCELLIPPIYAQLMRG